MRSPPSLKPSLLNTPIVERILERIALCTPDPSRVREALAKPAEPPLVCHWSRLLLAHIDGQTAHRDCFHSRKQ